MDKRTIINKMEMVKGMKFIAILIVLLYSNNLVKSQTETIKLWPNNAPGTPINSGLAHKEFHDDRFWTYNVTEASIDVYLPAKDRNSGTAIIICPGGGYGFLAMGHEGKDVAKWLNDNGITGIVLKYRLPNDTIMENKSIGPLQDAQEAMRLTRRNAKIWDINPNKIGIMGFSAGGHLASTLSTQYNEKVYNSDTTSARPDFSILVYPVISMKTGITHGGSRTNLLGNSPSSELINKFSNETQVNASTPPAFLVHALDDGLVPCENSIDYAMALRKNNIPVELHLYQQGGHGFGLALASKNTEHYWPDGCIAWLKSNGFLK
jgi:acetyl esterase/lipase